MHSACRLVKCTKLIKCFSTVLQSSVLTYEQSTLGQLVQHSLKLLRPHTQYRVDVVTRLTGAAAWSSAKSVYLQTQPGLPVVSPQVCPQCFSAVRSNGRLHCHSVAIYWQVSVLVNIALDVRLMFTLVIFMLYYKVKHCLD